MCCWTAACCRTKSATCVCAFVVIHIVLAVTLIAALFTRFYVHSTYEIGDMPTDTRLLLSPGPSIFCSRYIVQSFIMDGSTSMKVRNEHEINSNTLPEFDYYSFKDDPRAPKPQVKKTDYSMHGFSSLVTYDYEYHHFRFMSGSEVNFTMCSEYVQGENPVPGPSVHNKTTSGLLVYFVDGRWAFNTLLAYLDKRDTGLPCQGDACPVHFKVSPKQHCENPSSLTEYTKFQSSANHTGEHYVVFYNPDNRYEGQKYRIHYDLSRYEFDLSNHTASDTYKRKVIANSKDFSLLKFRYKRNSTYDKLYNIEVDYSCDPNSIVYVAVFFFAPVAVVIILGVIVLCCYERRRSSRRMVSLEETAGPGIHGDRTILGYGSTEPVYS